MVVHELKLGFAQDKRVAEALIPVLYLGHTAMTHNVTAFKFSSPKVVTSKQPHNQLMQHSARHEAQSSHNW